MPRKTKKQQAEDEFIGDIILSAIAGLVIGIAHIERDAQLLGKPHTEKMCLLGERCRTVHIEPKETKQ